MNSTPINLLHWNCNGIRARSNEIQLVLDNIDIACIQETRLTESAHFRLQGYNVLRKERENDSNGGGIMTLFNTDLTYEAFDTPTLPDFELLGATVTSLESNLNVINIYRKPAHLSTDIKEETWKILLDFASALAGNTIICGDFNAHDRAWSLNSNPKGEALGSVLSESNFLSLNDRYYPTIINRINWSKGSPDIALADVDLALQSNWERSDSTYGSDHFPIKITIGNVNKINFTNRKKINTNKLNWGVFSQEVEQGLNGIKCKNISPPEKYGKLIELIESTLLSRGGKKSENLRRRKKKYPPWWDSVCDSVVELRIKCMKLYFSKCSEENFNAFKAAEENAKKVLQQKKKVLEANFAMKLTHLKT